MAKRIEYTERVLTTSGVVAGMTIGEILDQKPLYIKFALGMAEKYTTWEKKFPKYVRDAVTSDTRYVTALANDEAKKIHDSEVKVAKSTDIAITNDLKVTYQELSEKSPLSSHDFVGVIAGTSSNGTKLKVQLNENCFIVFKVTKALKDFVVEKTRIVKKELPCVRGNGTYFSNVEEKYFELIPSAQNKKLEFSSKISIISAVRNAVGVEHYFYGSCFKIKKGK